MTTVERVTVPKTFRFLVTLENEAGKRTEQIETRTLKEPSFEALVQRVIHVFPGCINPNETQLQLQYKKGNGIWARIQDTKDLINGIKDAIKDPKNKECMTISAERVAKAARDIVTPVEVTFASTNTVLLGPAAASLSDRRADHSTVALFKKNVAPKKKVATSTKHNAKTKGMKKGDYSASHRSVEERVLYALAEFKVLKIDEPSRDHIVHLSGYAHTNSTGICKALKKLKDDGKIEYCPNHRMRLLPSGVDQIKAELAAIRPTNNAQVHDRIKKLLERLVVGKSKELFDALLAADGEPLTIDDLVRATGYKHRNSTGFDRPFSMMKSIGIVKYSSTGSAKTVQLSKKLCFPFDEDTEPVGDTVAVDPIGDSSYTNSSDETAIEIAGPIGFPVDDGGAMLDDNVAFSDIDFSSDEAAAVEEVGTIFAV